MSFKETHKLCNARRLEIKLHRVKITVLSNKSFHCNEVKVPAKKRKHETAKKTIESTFDAKKKAAENCEYTFYITEDQVLYVVGELCSKCEEDRVDLWDFSDR